MLKLITRNNIRFLIAKQVILIILVICKSTLLYSQDKSLSFGLKGGLTSSSIKQVESLPGTYSYKPGFGIMMYLKLKTSSVITFETDLGYYQNGYKHTVRSLIVAPDYTAQNSSIGSELLETQNYMNNSWLVGCEFGERFTLNLNAGVYWSVYLNTSTKSTAYTDVDQGESSMIPGLEPGYHETTEKETSRSEAISNFDFGLSGGIICGYNINPKYQLKLITRYYHGLIDIDKSEALSDVEKYNRSFFTGIGVEIKL